MNITKINQFPGDYFGYEVLSRLLGISPASARVTANRYVKNGVLLRARRNLYVVRDKLQYFDRSQKFKLANLVQAPSYISLMTALDYYQITTQMQRDFIESLALKRTKEVTLGTIVFNYTRISPGLYYGFIKENGFFIASPEKAFLDAVYLTSLGRYNFDWTALDRHKLNFTIIKREIKKFPLRTRRLLEQNGYL
jgi:predicted transcriptional regulator of viral defense system